MKVVVSVIASLILSIVLAGAADIATTAEAPKWVGQVMGLLSYLSVMAAFLFALTGLWVHRKQIIAWFKDLSKSVSEPKAEPVSEPEEAKPIQQTMSALTTLLSQLNPKIQEGDARLMDAKMATDLLVKQVLKVVEKITNMESQIVNLDAALEAINTGQRDKISYAAGKIQDQTLRQLLRSPHIITRESYRANVIDILFDHKGTLEHWSVSYEKFAGNLCIQISIAMNRITAMETWRPMLEASQPVLEIHRQLTQAADALQLRAQPSLRMAARQSLPAPIVEMLDY